VTAFVTIASFKDVVTTTPVNTHGVTVEDADTNPRLVTSAGDSSRWRSV